MNEAKFAQAFLVHPFLSAAAAYFGHPCQWWEWCSDAPSSSSLWSSSFQSSYCLFWWSFCDPCWLCCSDAHSTCRGQSVTMMVRPMTGKSFENANHFLPSCKNWSQFIFLSSRWRRRAIVLVVGRWHSRSKLGSPSNGHGGWVLAAGTGQEEDNDSIMRRPTGYLQPNWPS